VRTGGSCEPHGSDYSDLMSCIAHRLATYKGNRTQVLTLLNRRLRMRTAFMLALVYFFCIAASPIALASAGSLQALQGAPDRGETIVKVHFHKDGSSYHHQINHHHYVSNAVPHDHSHHGKGHPENCCGMLCLMALGVEVTLAFSPPICSSPIALIADDGPGGTGSSRLYRPPDASLSS
jgi:hypothetical protein